VGLILSEVNAFQSTDFNSFVRACRAAMAQIRKGGTSLEAVAAAIAVLEVKACLLTPIFVNKIVAYSMYVNSRMILLLTQAVDQI
jgi:hypothetical protein